MGAARLPRLARVAFAVCAAWLALHELHAVIAPDLSAGPLFSRYAHDVLLLGASALAVAGALVTHRGKERVAWLLIAAGVLAWSLAEIYYTAVLWTDPSPPLPSPADVGYLLFPVLAGTGGVLLLKARARGVPRRRWLDGVTAALSVAAVSGGIVFQTVLEHAGGETLGVATALSYPITDLILLGLFVGALAGTGWQLDRAWMLLAMGVTTFWLADSLYLVHTAQGTYESGGWFDAGWWAGLTLIAVAAWQPRPSTATPPEERLRAIALPLAFALVGLALLVYGAAAGLNPLAIALAAASILAVMARTVVVFEDNVAMLRNEALTDMLTELGNRRALTRALDERLKEITPERPLVLALFDLDGFKHYNDTFGHPAGDALLVRLGHKLAAFMEGRGQVFRMGGDEFCALFAPGPEGPGPVVVGAAHALTEAGEGFNVGCSHGAILLPAEAGDAVEALRLADQRMYANKYAARSSSSGRSADSLLRALAERDPDLASRAGATEFVAAIAGLLDTPSAERVAPLYRALADDGGE